MVRGRKKQGDSTLNNSFTIKINNKQKEVLDKNP